LSAASNKPAGLDSGKALETYYEIESDRFQTVGQAFENSLVDLNDITLGLMKIISADNPGMHSTYYSPDIQKTIKWSDVQLERDEFDIQVFPVSVLPTKPEGKYSMLQNLLATNAIDMMTFKRLLRLPDVDAYINLDGAEIDFIRCQVAKMVDGEPQEPDINQNFALAGDYVQKSYFYYKTKNLDPKCLILFESYLQAIERLQVVKTAQTEILMQQAMQEQAQNLGVQNGSRDTNATPSAAIGTYPPGE
jgi:hypothetical protein